MVTGIQRALGRSVRITTAYPLVTLALALILALVSVGYTFLHLEFQTSRKDLVSSDERIVRLGEEARRFHDMDSFVVAVENRDADRAVEFIRALASRLESDTRNYAQVDYRIDPDDFRSWALWFLGTPELGNLVQSIEERADMMARLIDSPSLPGLLREVNREITVGMVGELFTGFLDEDTEKDQGNRGRDEDISFLIELFGEMSRRLEGENVPVRPWNAFFQVEELNEDGLEGYFRTPGGDYFLVFVTPTLVSGFTKAQHALTALRDDIGLVRKDFPDIRAGVTGQEALNMDEMSVAVNDMTTATLVSLAGLGILLIAFWRSVRRPMLELTELILALSYTFGLTTLFIGHLNILSVTFAPLLLGLGIDYGIHWFARYQEEERINPGQPRKEIVEAVMLQLGPGILIAGVTAALSFLPLAFTGFKGLAELGVITAMGMVMTTMTTLCVLPTLTLLFDRSPRRTSIQSTAGTRTVFYILTPKRTGLFLAVGGLLVVASLIGARKVSFDLNLLNLQSREAESVVWANRLLNDSNRATMYASSLAHSKKEIKERTRRFESLPTVSEVQSVETFLPQDREAKVPLMAKLKAALPGPGRISEPEQPLRLSELESILSKIRFKLADTDIDDVSDSLRRRMEEARDLLDRLREQLSDVEPSRAIKILTGYQTALVNEMKDRFELLRENVQAPPMQPRDLPVFLRESFVDPQGLYLIRIFPDGNIWQPDFMSRFVKEIQTVDPDVVGDPIILDSFTRKFRDACIRGGVYAVAFIFLLLLVVFRNLYMVGLAISPLLVGTIWTLGLMSVFDVHLNLANTIFLPLVVGAGVEYGIIMVQRLRAQDTNTERFSVPFSTAKGVVLAGLTTTVGFGSLMISHHSGIFSLGLLATVGSISTLAAAVFFLPALFRAGTLRRGFGKRPSQ